MRKPHLLKDDTFLVLTDNSLSKFVLFQITENIFVDLANERVVVR